MYKDGLPAISNFGDIWTFLKKKKKIKKLSFEIIFRDSCCFLLCIYMYAVDYSKSPKIWNENK